MINVLLFNLKSILSVFGIYVMCVTANITASCYYNTKKLRQPFDIHKLMDGIVKMLSVGITTALLAMVITLIPYVPYLENMFTEDGSKLFCLTAILLHYVSAIKKYYLKAYQTTQDILENRSIIDDISAKEREL